MSNQIKKRKIFSSDSESDNDDHFLNVKKSKETDPVEPDITKKFKKQNDDADDVEKKIEVVNSINAVKKDSLLQFLEEEDQKLSTKQKSDQKTSSNLLKSTKGDKNQHEGNEDSNRELNQEEGEDDDSDDNEIQDNKSHYQNQMNYDQDSTNDKDNSFDGQFTFKDDDDFYIQANKNRLSESQQEKDIIKIVKERNGKIISKARKYIFTVICFKNHVFDADMENIIKKWCPQCHSLHQEYAQYAISQEGELESEFFQPKLNFRCKFFHRWTIPEMNCIKQKIWCPKCPEVLNLMINHHHRGKVNDDEKIQQISEQAELVADGFQVTNPKVEFEFDFLKDLYFIQLVPLSLYNRYLQSFRIQDQIKEFKKKLALMHPDNNSHPLAEKVTEKLYKMFEHLIEPSDDQNQKKQSSE